MLHLATLKLQLATLKRAVKEVPEVRLAIGVLGLVAAVGLISSLMTPTPKTLLAVLGIFAIMVLLVVLATARKMPDKSKRGPASAIMWICVLAFAIVVLPASCSISFGWPPQLAQALGMVPPAPPAEPTITFTGTRLNEKQKTSLDSLGVVLKEPDEVFNAKGHDYENRPIENWICKFESVDPKPKSPEQGRKFTVDLNDKFKAVCILKPGVAGDELEHLKHGAELTIAKAWSRSVSRGLVPDEKNDTISTKGLFLLLNCELKMPL